jgi:hypothetical protein
MGRVCQCPYKTSFLFYFFRICTLVLIFKLKKINFQILGNFVLIGNSRQRMQLHLQQMLKSRV